MRKGGREALKGTRAFQFNTPVPLIPICLLCLNELLPTFLIRVPVPPRTSSPSFICALNPSVWDSLGNGHLRWSERNEMGIASLPRVSFRRPGWTDEIEDSDGWIGETR